MAFSHFFDSHKGGRMAPFVSVPAKTADNTCVQYHTSLPWAIQGSLVCACSLDTIKEVFDRMEKLKF